MSLVENGKREREQRGEFVPPFPVLIVPREKRSKGLPMLDYLSVLLFLGKKRMMCVG